jgi:hypothetical protein
VDGLVQGVVELDAGGLREWFGGDPCFEGVQAAGAVWSSIRRLVVTGTAAVHRRGVQRHDVIDRAGESWANIARISFA